MESRYNLRSPAVKRLMKEAQELRNATEEYFAQPLEDNLFEWHFTVRGPSESDFDGGLYHGRIILPPDYPMKPPSIILLTPNGRFETHKKICLSISGHHPESWQPSWSIRTALLAIIGFMPTHGNGAIGSLDYTPEERKKLALKSQSWCCPNCGSLKGVLRERTTSPGTTSKDAQEAKELATQISLKAQKENGDTMVLNHNPASVGMEDGLRHRNVLDTMATIAPTAPTQPIPDLPAPLPSPPIELHQQGPDNPLPIPHAQQHHVHTLSSPSNNKLCTLAIFFLSFFLFLLIIRRLFFL